MLRLTSQGFVVSPAPTLAKVFTVTKNEYDLIEDFIRYYGTLFGYENVIILDNESDHPAVLDVYTRYIPKGVTVRTVVGYSGSSQGDHFTRAMREYKEAAEFLIGLDTDCFLCVNRRCDPNTIRSYLRALPADCDIFSIHSFLLSVVNPRSDNYVNNKLVRPTRCTTFIERDGYAGFVVRHVFFRARSFVHTENGNHNGSTTTNRYHRCPEVSYIHYHDTGKRRHLERCKTILLAYGMLRKDMSEAEELNTLLQSTDGTGIHRQRQYIQYLQNPDSFFQEDSIPSDVFEFTELIRILEDK